MEALDRSSNRLLSVYEYSIYDSSIRKNSNLSPPPPKRINFRA
jgi:hypothetical protein